MATRTKTASEAAVDRSVGRSQRRPRTHFRHLSANGDTWKPTSIRWVFCRPCPIPICSLEGEFAEEARRVYCGTVGAEFMHITDPERRRWIQERMEGPQPAVDQQHVLDQLIRADLFEQVLQQRYLGNKRFSLEGVTALIPLVDEVLEAAGQRGALNLVMGMSHRGRLNVIVHVARRAPEEVFAGFEDVDPRSVLGSGDVKYHMGATGEYVTRCGAKVHIHLVSNPSHLEAVDPGDRRTHPRQTGPRGRRRREEIPAAAGPWRCGVRRTGHFGRDTELCRPARATPWAARYMSSSTICSASPPFTARNIPRVSRRNWRAGSPFPIFHVNAEDVDAVVRVARMALEYRYTFGSDVVVDLIGYRRHGHSEVDDPTVTQPLLYKAIKDHPPLWEIYAEDTGAENVQARVEADPKRNWKQRRKRPSPSARSRRCAICPSIGTTTKAAATSPNMKSKLASQPRNSAKLPPSSRLIPRVSHPSQGEEVARTASGNGRPANARWITAWRKRWPSAAW